MEKYWHAGPKREKSRQYLVCSHFVQNGPSKELPTQLFRWRLLQATKAPMSLWQGTWWPQTKSPPSICRCTQKLLGDARAFPSHHSARARSGMGQPICYLLSDFVRSYLFIVAFRDLVQAKTRFYKLAVRSFLVPVLNSVRLLTVSLDWKYRTCISLAEFFSQPPPLWPSRRFQASSPL
jgi:hypothetical protein